VAASGAIDLRADWRVHEGEVAGGEREALDDAAWDRVAMPATIEAPGARTYWLRRRFTLAKGTALTGLALDLGGRAGTSSVWLNGKKLPSPAEHGPFFARDLPLRDGENVLAIQVRSPTHVGGLRTYGASSLGAPELRRRGLVYPQFKSAVDGTTQTLAVYLPFCADLTTPRPLVVALPGWSGDVHVFSHSRLLAVAEQRGWIVVVPDPRGNLLYTGKSELGVLEAIDRVRADLKIDDARVHLTGVSMGGAGALQIGYHFPDRFASIAAWYGDSLYDLATYVGPILRTKANAERYSVLRFAENARALPVLLIHAKDDRVSAFSQSKMLADLDAKLALPDHRLLALETGGHTLAVVEKTLPEVEALFARAVRPSLPARVTFATGSASYPGAFWLRVAPKHEGTIGLADAELDVATAKFTLRRADAAVGVVTIDLSRASVKLPLVIEVAKGVSIGAKAPEIALAGLSPKATVTIDAKPPRAVVADDHGVALLGHLPVGESRLR
jgi:pimeloyl-ACP methyl ester carboxylesterase